MTREEILSMNVGKELDLLVAQQVMHWDVNDHDIPDFSVNMEAAWVVVRKSRLLQSWGLHHKDNHWCLGDIKARTAPEAICKAALFYTNSEKKGEAS